MFRGLAGLVTVTAVFVAVALTGCTSTEPTAVETMQTAPFSGITESSATAISGALPTGPSLSPDLTRGSESDRCSADGYAIDSGPVPMANGTVERDAKGRPITYIVAEGDAPQAIQKRLCITGLLECDGLNRYIQPGERLTIDPTSPIP